VGRIVELAEMTCKTERG